MLFALAFDHRSSLRREFLRLHTAPRPEDVARCRGLKAVVFEGLIAAVADGLRCGDPAILIDEEYGADVIGRARETGLAFIVPVEVSGCDELAFEHGDDGFGDAIERIDPTYVKVLLHYDPWGSGELNHRQRARLQRLQGWLTDHGRDWMLELLVPPTTTERDRPGVTVRAIAQLIGDGLRPAFWKLEGMPSTAAYETVAAATCGSERADPSCLVLGRGADQFAVERWLQLAAPVPAYRGFAVGRTLWWEPLHQFVTGRGSAQTVIDGVAGNYRRLVDVYLEAMNGAA